MRERDLLKYITRRVATVERFEDGYGSGTNVDLGDITKKRNIVLTAFHVIKNLYNKSMHSFDTGNAAVNLYYFDKDDLYTEALPIKSIVGYDNDLDIALLELDTKEKWKKAELLLDDEPKLFEKVYNSGVAPFEYPFARSGRLAMKTDNNYVYDMPATFGDSGSGIFVMRNKPKLAGMLIYVTDTEGGGQIQYLGLSKPTKMLMEFLKHYL